jgi:uncharacterized protein (TIGR01777 family)
MRVLISGSSGLIGSSLVASLRVDGHDVRVLVRRPAQSPSEVTWKPERGINGVDDSLRAAVAESDAVVNLAGAGVADKRWDSAYKAEIMSSRVNATTCLATAIAQVDSKPKAFVSGSAGGYYGDTGAEAVDEAAPAGRTFLAGVASAWEEAAQPASDAGVRVTHPRTGTVADPHGGAFGRLLPLLRAGAGGPLGSGRQWWSLISLRDEVAALRHLIDNSSVTGPVNFSAPQQATNGDLTRELAKALHRPAVAAAPKFAVKAVLGEFADELFIDQRMAPAKLLASGFTFADPTIASIVNGLVQGS